VGVGWSIGAIPLSDLFTPASAALSVGSLNLVLFVNSLSRDPVL